MLHDEDRRPAWTFEGYKLWSGEFTTAMAHYFRAEIQRSNVWRTRLDATTNWAVVSVGATLSIAFGQSASHHAIILLCVFLLTLFLYIEARRYRYYELWSYRVRLMETDFYAAMLTEPNKPSPDWAKNLAASLRSPRFPISIWEALGRRLRRNYIWLFAVLGLAWLAKLGLFPTPAANWAEIISHASLGILSGQTVFIIWAVYHFLLLLFSLVTVGLRQSTGEVLPLFIQSNHNKHG